MSRLAPAAYLDHIRADSARLAAVLDDCPPDVRVPSCPDWDATDLLWHVAGVQHFWHHVITTRPAPPDDYAEPERPATRDEVRALFHEWHERFVDALASADPAEKAWSWADAPEHQNVGFSYRRQAHEALIHRLDAELTAGAVTALDGALAADGVDEVLSVMYGGTPVWGRFDPLPGHVEFRMTDVGESVWARLGLFSGTSPASGTTYDREKELQVVPGAPRTPDLVVSGRAADLDAWLWHRRDRSGIDVTGDDDVAEQVLAVLRQPID